jgi:hypothetical protein
MLLLASAAAICVRALMGPAEGSVITKPASVAAKSTESQPVQLEQFDGTYISFVYPDSFTVNARATAEPPMLEKHLLVTHGVAVKLLTMVVMPLPHGGLQEDSSYLMRTQHPDLYQMRTVTVNGEPVTIAKKAGTFEQVAFWPHGGKLLTIAISGSSSDTATDETMYTNIVKSVTWR